MMVKIVLLLAVKTSGDFAQQLILFLPPRFQCPREDLLKMIAVVHCGVKEDNVGALFGSREFVLQGWITIQSSPEQVQWQAEVALFHRPSRRCTKPNGKIKTLAESNLGGVPFDRFRADSIDSRSPDRSPAARAGLTISTSSLPRDDVLLRQAAFRRAVLE